MSESKWEHVEDVAGSRVVIDGRGFSSPYWLEPGSGRDERQVRYNLLIAAAPELKKACEKAISRLRQVACDFDVDIDDEMKEIREALAKAEGKP